MKRIFFHIAFCVALFFSVNCFGADSPSRCFDRFVNYYLPFEIFALDDWSVKYIKPLEEGYGSPTYGSPFIEYADQVFVSPLCNDNFVVVWSFSHHKFPMPLTGRIFNSEFRTVFNDFPITEKSETENWEHSVSTLYDNGFVVSWKTWKTRARKEIKLRGRIFDNAGKPKGNSFDIYTRGTNNGGYVYGLPGGVFVVVWSNNSGDLYKGAALLRIFDKRGVPRTKGIIVEPDPEDKSCLLKPRAYITKEGNINIFMVCQSTRFDQNYFFHSARSFNEVGKPLTGVLSGEDIISIEGFEYLKEEYLDEWR